MKQKLVENDTLEKENTIKDEIDPFKNSLSWSFIDLIQIFILSLTLAPLRLICIVTLSIFAWIVSKFGLACTSFEEATAKPFTGWRKKLQSFIPKIFRAVAFCMGIHNIKITGVQASKKTAPILVCAPHSTVVDGLVVLLSRSSVVAKQEIAGWPVMGPISTFLQSLFIMRQAADSRKNVHELIKNRALDSDLKSDMGNWPQILIFPEGTVTNAKALIKFKTGAFRPGLPVQPVLIKRYFGSGLDTLTKTWNQPHGYLGCLWLTLCQFNTNLEIEFLPVYEPSEEEILDSATFAQNVRALMAKKLNVPMVERSVSEFMNKKT